ncbi:extracellular solute-binding protein [Paenibacillus alkalitolerans]|uniref:extracellular solute-binding protein n=1 Tax=Paenibacillus alkalitolerans TaxID=2799335 RepID=UPI0018F57339|nr:extracellular solute-binding protein [Paenibacillus alkalitolerans]
MKKTKKRWITALLSACLAMVVVLSACSQDSADPGGGDAPDDNVAGGTNDNPPAAAEDKYDNVPKKISVSMFDRGQVSSDEGTYEENRWVKWIREQSGIDVSFVPVPRNQAQEKFNVLVASGQAPDLLWEYDRNYIGTLVTQGVIQPIDEYIEKYSTSYKKYLEENPELKPYLTFDGKMYAATSKRTLFTIANHGMWIRQDWLDKLNLKTPTTIDELVQVAQAFKENIPGSVPIVGYTTIDIYAALYGAIYTDWYLEDGKMVYGPTTDRFGDVIELERKVYELGLVDKEYLTDKDNQRAIQLWVTGKAGICMCQWSGSKTDIMMTDLMKNDPEAKPVPLESVATPYGTFGTYQETPAFMYITFNKDMKNPKAAVEYLDWMIEKGWRTLVYGTEGVHHKLVDGVAQKLDADQFKKEVSYANEYAILRNETVKPEDLIIAAAPDEISQKYANLRAQALETVMKHEFRRDFPYQPSFAEINEIKASLKTTIDELRAKVVMQGGTYNGKWALEEIRKEWKRLGGEEAEKLAQEWYDQNKANF